MDVRPLKMGDACAISGYSRDQMRALLRDLPGFANAQSSGKNRIFTRVELLTISIIAFMEQRYGIKRAAVGSIVEELISTLQSPRVVDPQTCLIVITGKASVSYSRLNEGVNEGLVIPLAPIFDQLDTYLAAKTTQKQIELSLEPSMLRKSS